MAGGPGDQRSPAIAAGSDGFVAMWETCLECETRGSDLAARALGRDGQPTGPVWPVETSAIHARAPRLAYNAHRDEFLAVWSVRFPGLAGRAAVRARRLSPSGEPIGAEIVVAEVEDRWPAAVMSSRGAWHGRCRCLVSARGGRRTTSL